MGIDNLNKFAEECEQLPSLIREAANGHYELIRVKRDLERRCTRIKELASERDEHVARHSNLTQAFGKLVDENTQMYELLLQLRPTLTGALGVVNKQKIDELTDPDGDMAWVEATKHHPNAPASTIEKCITEHQNHA